MCFIRSAQTASGLYSIWIFQSCPNLHLPHFITDWQTDVDYVYVHLNEPTTYWVLLTSTFCWSNAGLLPVLEYFLLLKKIQVNLADNAGALFFYLYSIDVPYAWDVSPPVLLLMFLKNSMHKACDEWDCIKRGLFAQENMFKLLFPLGGCMSGDPSGTIWTCATFNFRRPWIRK